MKKIVLPFLIVVGLPLALGAFYVHDILTFVSAEKRPAFLDERFPLSDAYRAADAAYKTGDYAAAFPKFLDQAKAGDPVAMTKAGYMYGAGEGVAKSPRLEFEWYMKAARKGYPPAQNNAGIVLESGVGVARDEAAARSLHLAALAQGYANAAVSLAIQEGRPYSTSPDIDAYRKWMIKAADLGDAMAQVHVAFRYFMDSDPLRFHRYLVRSARQGNAPARLYLWRKDPNYASIGVGWGEMACVYIRINLLHHRPDACDGYSF